MSETVNYDARQVVDYLDNGHEFDDDLICTKCSLSRQYADAMRVRCVAASNSDGTGKDK